MMKFYQNFGRVLKWYSHSHHHHYCTCWLDDVYPW